ncbi:MAG TPA: hypothetical protein VG713_21980 [Pirellulales bacterium]|jgi:hypothetical protein|nr:hypothetical protein [Pirellulales bacterium]
MSCRRLVLGLFAALIVAAVACTAWAPMALRAVVAALVIDEPIEHVDWVVPLGGDRACERAAETVHAHIADRILLARNYPSRLVRYDILPSGEQLALDRITAAGIPATEVDIALGEARTYNGSLRELARWLEQHPQTTVAIYCSRLEGRRLALIRSRSMPPALAERVSIVALRDRDLDESCWWRNRGSSKRVLNAWIELSLEALFGEMPPEPDNWDPDQYERGLH